MHRHHGAGDPASRSQPRQGPGTEDQIDVQFDSGPDAAACARNTLCGLEGRVHDDLLADIRLLVSELVTNSVRHSNICQRDAVTMRVGFDGTALRVEVCDPGQGFVPKQRDLDRDRPGGWGLYLVERLADRWGVDGDGLTRVWFEIDRTDVPRPANLAA